MNSPYKCRLCGHNGIVTFDESGLWMFKLEIWLPKIVCDRCGKYVEDRRRASDAIFRACRILETATATLDAEKRGGIETRIREKLNKLTQRFSSIVCSYHRLTDVWEPDFPDMLCASPTKAGKILSDYVFGISKMARNKP